jgi:hypothetical protein
LLKLLGDKRLVTTLLFSGSIHGWMVNDFHSKCDNKRPTISLFKIKDGDCIGGYTNTLWLSPWLRDKYVVDSDAMLFNLSCQRHFPNKGTGYEILCGSGFGPCFEGGGGDLSVYLSPFNGDKFCLSYA